MTGQQREEETETLTDSSKDSITEVRQDGQVSEFLPGFAACYANKWHNSLPLGQVLQISLLPDRRA
jgi:hypothetical protein